MNKPKVSIVILDFLKSKRVCQNVESIQKQVVDFDVEIIIVDNSCNAKNAEKLQTLSKYKNVQLVLNKKNLGYIQANNQGAEMATGEYLMIVNPDIIWTKTDILGKLVKFMDQNKKVGICGPKQINDNNGEVAMTVRAFPNLFIQVARRTFLRKLPLIKKWVAYDEMRHLDYEKLQTVDWLQSSFWIIRKDLWKKLGGLNKQYFLFMSDPDLCFKCWEAGYEVVYNPEVEVHADGVRVSEGGMVDFFRRWTMRQHLKDSIIYQLGHWTKKNPHRTK